LKTRLDKLNKDLEELNALRGMLDEMENGVAINEIRDLSRKVESVKKDIADVETLLKEGIFENELGGGRRKRKTAKKTKNKSSSKKCEKFCKNDYMVEMKKVFKKSSEKYNIPYESPTKQQDEFAYNVCKKTFCNENCKGFDFNGDKKQQFDFKKKIKNGFQNSYSANKVEMLKKRGAASGCVDVGDYDVFHK